VLKYLGSRCPVWLSEGLAQYFENAQFRGGQLVAGQVPVVTLMSLRQALTDGKFIPVANIAVATSEDWHAAVKARDADLQYDEAWAMVHCLEAADGGKYRAAFIQYMKLISQGQSGAQAWATAFGAPPAAFEKRLRQYIQEVKPTGGAGCRSNLVIIARMLIRTGGRIADLKELRDAALQGTPDGTPTTAFELLLEGKDPALLKMIFRCPEDASAGDDPSYELLPAKEGEPPVVRCRHHAGYVLETVYKKVGGGFTIEVAARPTLVPPPPPKPATPEKKPAPAPAEATKP
jgi:hypothetical protein